MISLKVAFIFIIWYEFAGSTWRWRIEKIDVCQLKRFESAHAIFIRRVWSKTKLQKYQSMVAYCSFICNVQFNILSFFVRQAHNNKRRINYMGLVVRPISKLDVRCSCAKTTSNLIVCILFVLRWSFQYNFDCLISRNYGSESKKKRSTANMSAFCIQANVPCNQFSC